MNEKDFLWLIGTGNMAYNYAKVLKSLKQPFKVIGRGKNSALIFKKKSGVDAKIGSLKLNIKKADIARESFNVIEFKKYIYRAEDAWRKLVILQEKIKK